MKEFKLENYYDDGLTKRNDNKKLVLIIYDIPDNKRRYKMVKFLERFGIRVQKSAFEMILDNITYQKLTSTLPKYIDSEDNVRVYRLPINGDVVTWGSARTENEDVIII